MWIRVEDTVWISTDGPSESPAPLDPDERFHRLQNERRRLVIRYLSDGESNTEDGHVRMRDVAERVAAWEHDTTVAQLDSTQRRRVYVPLYQNHLPKLDGAGVIDYDQTRDTIIPTERVDRLARFLDETAVAETDSPDGEQNDARFFRISSSPSRFSRSL